MKHTLFFIVPLIAILLTILLVPLLVRADSIPEYIALTAQQYGVNPQLALYISYKESKWDPNAVGDHGTSHGFWQIHLPAHTKISKKQADDIYWSTEWAMKEMAKNGCKIWSTCPQLAFTSL